MLRKTSVVFALLFVILAIVSSATAIPCKQSCVKKCEDAETAHEECIKKCIPACKRDKKNDHLAKLSEMQKRQQEVQSEEKKLEEENKAYFEREERLALLKLTNRAQYERLVKQEKERKEKEQAAKVAAEEKQREQLKAQERTHRQEMEVREVQLHRTQKDINNRLLKLLLAIRHKRGHNVELGFAGEMQLNSKLNILVDRVYRERRFRQHSCAHTAQCAANAASSGQCSCHCDTGMDLDEWWYSNDNRTDAMNNNARYDYINHPELFLRDFPGDMASPVPSKSGAAGTTGSGATAQQVPTVRVGFTRHVHKWREEDEDDELVLQTKGLTRSFLNACASANQVCQTPEAYSIKAFCRKFVRLCTPYGLYRRKF